jgi:hypothetical protein
MAILNNSNAITTTGGYDVNNSLRIRKSASAYLNRTNGTSTNQNKGTWSFWFKRGQLGVAQRVFEGKTANTDAGIMAIEFFADDTFVIGGWNANWRVTTQVFRDPSAWYHIVVAVDTTQATANNRILVYVNGSQITAFGTTNNPTQNSTFGLNNNSASLLIGVDSFSLGRSTDGYLAEVNFIDGQTLTPSDFGSTDTTTGVWKPKAYTGTYGTNGYYLKFSDIATTSGSNAGLGKDFSGNTNYWTTNNISVTSGVTYDAMTDSPTNTSATVANYATLNYIDTNTASSISGANLNWTSPGVDREIRGTIGVSSGKYYWEVVVTSGNTAHVGVDTLNTTILSDYVGSTSTSWGINLSNGNKRNAGSSVSYGSSFADNDIMMCALDMDNSKIWWGKNGTWFASGDPAAGTNAAFTNLSGYTLAFACTPRNSSSVNFGQRPFAYTPPTGFVRLNTYNLPTPAVLKGNTVMDATLYTGTGSSLSVTNAGAFKPDFVWVKGRSGATDHALSDSVRGATSDLVSNSSAAATTQSTGLTAFDTSGFTVGALAKMNTNTSTYVGWQWKGGNSSGVSNTDGSITTTISASATAGFSVIKFTGTQANATIGHGLGVAPKMVIVKTYGGGTRGWRVYHASVGNTKYLILNDTSAETTDSTAWNNTTPTSTVISLGANGETNNGGSLMIAYAWAEIAGFSRFGSYTGNGSADGPFVYLGFRPKFILIKSSSASATNWSIRDTTRDSYNVSANELNPNLSDAEGTTPSTIDVLSNGFKFRGTSAGGNGSGTTYIYAAFAESPFASNNRAR